MSFIDFCTDNFMDKLLSLPLKMNDNKFTHGTSLCLLSNSPNFYHRKTDEELINDFFQSGVYSHLIDNQDNSLQKIRTDSLIQNQSYNFLRSNKFVSPHVTDFVQNTIRFLNFRSDMFSPNSINISNMFNDCFFNSGSKENTYSNPTINSVDKQLDIASVQEPKITMSVTVEKKICNMVNKCNVPNGVMLNLELASRKTKELQKRSKKRRRRQKKNQCTIAKSSNSNLRDEVDSCKNSSPISSRVCFSSSPNDEPEFVVHVKHQVQMVPNLVSSFLISVENGSDDSDWDSCTESDILTETDEFELTGLVFTSQNTPSVCSTPYSSFNVKMNLTTLCEDSEDEEMCKFQAALLQVNKKWNESTKGLRAKPKSTPKVSFAPGDQLVEVFPVEICERKGEWETYATERLRFNRRINELAKVILPCLAAEHRLEVYRKVIEPTL